MNNVQIAQSLKLMVYRGPDETNTEMRWFLHLPDKTYMHISVACLPDETEEQALAKLAPAFFSSEDAARIVAESTPDWTGAGKSHVYPVGPFFFVDRNTLYISRQSADEIFASRSENNKRIYA